MKNQKGITLIALVITIIVMLILVGVSVTVALNGGLFTTAKQAAEETAIKRNEELALSDGRVNVNGIWYDSMHDYVANKPSSNQNASSGSGNEEEPAIPTITLTPETITGEIESGTTQEVGTITATVSNVDGDLVWSITPTDSGLELVDTDTANVKKIKASKAVENATITVSYGTVSDTCSVTITEKEAEYTIGQEVTIGTEHFYVIAQSEETVTLLAKDCINTTTLLQDVNASQVAFATGVYWTSSEDIDETETEVDEATGKITLPASHTAAKAAYDYGRDLGGIGRLMTKKEAEDLLAMNDADITDIIYGINEKSSSDLGSYWLATDHSDSYNVNNVWYVNNDVNEIQYNSYSYPFFYVRPVVEISKSDI